MQMPIYQRGGRKGTGHQLTASGGLFTGVCVSGKKQSGKKIEHPGQDHYRAEPQVHGQALPRDRTHYGRTAVHTPSPRKAGEEPYTLEFQPCKRKASETRE